MGDGKANGLYYINIPGQVYTPKEISSDAFSRLISFTEFDDPIYGVNVKNGEDIYNKMGLIDGTLKYEIKDTKMDGNEIYLAIGFKISDYYWCNTSELKNALSLTIETKTENSETINIKDSYSMDVKVNGTKNTYLSGSSTSANARAGVVTSGYTFGFHSSPERPLLYSQMGYTITYPEDVEIEGVSFSTSNATSVVSGSYGRIRLGEKIDNGNGTYSTQVTIGPGLKSANTSSFIANYYKFSEDIEDGETRNIIYSDSYYIPAGQTEAVQMKYSQTKDTHTVKYTIKNTEDKADSATITSINRYVGNSSGVYNWNIGRDENDLLRSTQMFSGANVVNNDTVPTDYSKTVKASFNITNENAIVNAFTIPVGIDEDGNNKTSVTVKYVGIKEDNKETSGTYTIINVKDRRRWKKLLWSSKSSRCWCKRF
ncbi:MAG: hypothetical protein HUJ68_00290 [Clostridia bacterium]|nr:hypothetical protein [Clostridia bacterium]